MVVALGLGSQKSSPDWEAGFSKRDRNFCTQNVLYMLKAAIRPQSLSARNTLNGQKNKLYQE